MRTRTHVKIGEERSSARAYAHAYARYGLPGARPYIYMYIYKQVEVGGWPGVVPTFPHGGLVRTRTHVKIGEERSSVRASAHAYAHYGLPGARHLHGIHVGSCAHASFLCAHRDKSCSKTLS